MPLNNLGAILTFACDLERADAAAFQAAGLDDKARISTKNIKVLERLRRENVTEMILEPIEGFTREPYVLGSSDPTALDARAVQFYQDAAAKLQALPEVARELQRMGKKRK